MTTEKYPQPIPTAACLPLTHPDYRYPPSRNPYWPRLRDFPRLAFTDDETEAHRGRWRETFADADPALPGAATRLLHVEIGCNAGHVVSEWAHQRPNEAFIGIDYKVKAVHRASEKAAQRDLPNLHFFRAQAVRLPWMFGPGEIDHLYLFFPDPWPRKAQWRNRFLTAERLRQLAPLLSKSGAFHIKTDHRGYFDWMEEAVAQVTDQWQVVERSEDLHAGHPDPQSLQIPDVTLFEKLFIRQRLPIHRLKLAPRSV